jgi:1-acyl-sn-glycerol-3-phosphate acyltransferase
MILLIALRSLAFLLAFYVGSVFYVLVGVVVAYALPAKIGRIATAWARYHRCCARLLLGQRIVIEGALPSGDVLYVIKHESMFETIDMLCVFDEPAIVAKRELFDIPVWGTVARRYGLIPVERTAGAKALRALRQAALAATAQGRAICLFAEGTRVPHGERPPLQSGFAGLYALLRLPVVPIALDTGRLSPRGKFLKRAGTITYRIGEIIPAGLDRREAEARAHAAINALNA